MIDSVYITSFFLGIIANLHCIGMCGPIALAIPLNRTSNSKIVFGLLQYNLARIIIYAFLGLIVGFIGMGMGIVGILQFITILTGFGIVIYAWRNELFPNFSTKINTTFFKYFSQYLKKVFQSKSPFKLIAMGSMNGLLPCGMVYTALITAALSKTPIQGFLTMLSFGLGTFPGMLIIAFFANKISNRFRNKANKFLPYLVTLIGLIILLRGLNLDIPWLSPVIHFNETTHTVESIDCYKPH